MPPDNRKLIGAIFDVKPVDKNGRLDVTKMENIKPVLCLKKNNLNQYKLEPVAEYGDGSISIGIASLGKSRKENDLGDGSSVPDIDRAAYVIELEEGLNQGGNSMRELSDIGARFVNGNNAKSKSRIRPITQNYRRAIPKIGALSHENSEHARIIAEIGKRPILKSEESYASDPMGISPLVSERAVLTNNLGLGDIRKAEVDLWLSHLQKNRMVLREIDSRKNSFFSRLRNAFFPQKLLVVSAILIIGGAIAYYGYGLKDNIVRDSNSAVQNLEDAKSQIVKMDFSSAAGSFTKAYEDFSKASENLNFMGASIGSLLADLPGASKIKSANNILEAGKLLADSGQVMAQSMDFIAKSGAILNPASDTGESMAKMLNSLKSGLAVTQRNLQKADVLLAGVDIQSLPEDKRASFEDLKSKLPIFNDLIAMSVDYSGFLEDLVGVRGAKKYLLLFQNPAELRATGGFPGSYGTISFQDGQLKEFFVDDVYNLDGQLKDNIIPPAQMQHITPTWGMRDANWFIDFPTSAKKIMWFYKKESGTDVDGVITFSPTIVAKILDIVGPVEMPEYGLILDGKNFASEIQDEVEYGKNRTQPKQILKDMAPRLLAKMYLADKDEWMAVFNVLVSSMEKKDVLMYFKNLSLQSFAYDKGFTGHVQAVDDDYLMVNISNIKGSKTDNVTDTSIKINTKLENGSAMHKLIITRKNNGGDQKYGFYNKSNPAYIRVLVPEGSELLSINGNSNPNFKPLVTYNKSDFRKDADLSNLESSANYDLDKNVAIQKEAGKTEFAFWMIVDPKGEQTVEIEYSTPLHPVTTNYELYIQKQPGLIIDNFEFSMDAQNITNKVESTPVLNKIGDRYILNGSLENDLPIKLNFE